MRAPALIVAVVALVLAIGLAVLASGGDDEPAGGGGDTTEATAGGGGGGGGGGPECTEGEGTTDLEEKPEPQVPDEPATELGCTDVVEGDGATVAEGDTVSVQYVGVNQSNGEQFDASWDRGAEPFTFTLGAGEVIPGWDEGVAGMKVGGRRQLVIPPDLGYGEQGQPPDIPGGETLVFVIDVVDVQEG